MKVDALGFNSTDDIWTAPLRRLSTESFPWEWRNGLRRAMWHPQVLAENRWEDDGGSVETFVRRNLDSSETDL